MRDVEVDPAARTARVNGGALLGELEIAAQAHGLVCPVGVVGHTGVAGLTLGGGVGRLQRHFGLTIDNLTAVELVTADGRLLRATADEEPELFWGLRGAGWNFGIATAFEFRLQPFGPHLHRGFLDLPGERRSTRSGRRSPSTRGAPPTPCRSCCPRARRCRTPATPMSSSGGPSPPSPTTTAARSRRSPATQRACTPGRSRSQVTAGSEPYLDVQTAHDLAMGWGRRSIIRSLNADDVRPEVLDELVELVAAAPDGASCSITALGGAIGRVDEDATAYAGRAARFDLSADSAWDDPAHDDVNVGWVRRAMTIFDPGTSLGGTPMGTSDAGTRRRAADLRRREARAPGRAEAGL